MTLVLRIVAPDTLPEEQKRELRLDRFGAVIGRSHHADWRLHDTQAYVSSVHCEVDYSDGCYWLVDRSRNGTLLNGGQRLDANAPHRIRMGDRYDLGGFVIEVKLLEVLASSAPTAPVSLQASEWSVNMAEAAPPSTPVEWGGRRAGAEIGGAGAMSRSFQPPAFETPVPVASESAGDVWSRHLASWETGPAPQPQSSSPAPAAPLPALQSRSSQRADDLLRQCIGGLRTLVESRARAKAHLGAQSTVLDLHGNNPIKFARSAEDALAQMLEPPQRGFMDGPEAVDDAFNDIQSHQLATLAAMQVALKATIDRFSPASIRGRVTKGFIDGLLPDARNAALWKTYESEFEGVVKGSNEAFMDVFSREFLKAYEQTARSNKWR